MCMGLFLDYEIAVFIIFFIFVTQYKDLCQERNKGCYAHQIQRLTSLFGK